LPRVLARQRSQDSGLLNGEDHGQSTHYNLSMNIRPPIEPGGHHDQHRR